jgi:uncharacterized lipoprotein YddW (UPF0748 family)
MLVSLLTRTILKLSLALSLVFVLSGLSNLSVVFLPIVPSNGSQPEQLKMRGVWVTPSSISTQEKVDHMLQRVEAGRFNAVFACVFYQGQSLFSSALVKTHPMVEPGFDPLAYLVNEAHRRNIEVHAWFVVGQQITRRGENPLLAEHPDWRLVGPDGGSIDWLNFNRPEVRQFLGSLAYEVKEQYGVNGVHLDYIRYPRPELGFDTNSMEAFQADYGLDANQLRYADLPAYGSFEANPLTNPSTANILATFSNGYPAVALNQYGAGEVVLMNWQANQRNVALSSEILKRSLMRLLQPGGGTFLLRSATNAERYGYDGLTQAKEWLEYLGWPAQELDEPGLESLDSASVLVLPNIYQITQNTASKMANFVQNGGGMIILDGPTPSIKLTEIQAITGMQSRGKYFKEHTIMIATGEHPLIPTSQREASLELFQSWDAMWKDFLRKGVTLTVQEVNQRVKSTSPHGIVSAVQPSANQERARELLMQDWQTWLQGGIIDVLIPLAYVNRTDELQPILDAWQPAIQQYWPITFGIKSYVDKGSTKVPKTPDQLITEIGMLRQAGINDFVIYEFDTLTDEQLAALAEDAHSTTSP